MNCKDSASKLRHLPEIEQSYIAVGEVILLKAIQIMANGRFFLGPSQPIPNSQIIFIVIFIIFIILNL